MQDKPFTQKGVQRLWRNLKAYVAENTYPKVPPPQFYFDPETSALYLSKESVGYDLIVVDSRLYYKER